MIEATLIGRMGNQMFQYAVCRSVAEHNGYDWYINPASWLGEQLFNVSFGGRGGAPIDKEYKEQDISPYDYDPNIWNIEDGTLLTGYFQSEKYFDHAKARKWFKLWPDIDADIIGEKYPVDEYCYINIRGTDVKELGCQKLSKDYYLRAMEVIKCLKHNPKFVIITDDVPFAKEYFPEIDAMTNSVRTDFTLLNRAKWLILADSSFSWWAAWLNENNKVVAPHGWLNININMWEFMPHDIRVNRWIWV